MFRRRTLLVVGAGASFEAGLPTGDELRTKISSMLSISFPDGYNRRGGDDLIYEALRAHSRNSGRNINDYLASARMIRDGMPLSISIDNYLEAHQHDELVNLCGKLAIVKGIVAAERGSKLYFDQHRSRSGLDTNGLNQTWYVKFMHALCEGVPRGQIRDALKNLTIITFNYDRCIEHFLAHALAIYYKISPNDAAKMICEDMNILHPYGSIGSHPLYGDSNTLEFGDTERVNLLSASEKIKTYTESVSDADQLQAAVDSSETIIFLGFSYLRQNLRLLTRDGGYSRGSRRVFGTTFGLSQAAVDEIAGELRQVFKKQGSGGPYPQENITLSAATCSDFLSAYQRTFTA